MHLFFSTPVWSSKIEHFEKINEELINYILNLQKNDPKGVTKSNFNGWHSKDFNLKDSAPQSFTRTISININKAINDMGWDLKKQSVKIPSMWAIINEKKAFNQRHHHGNSDLSAAYYVSAPIDCGDILFYDPRPAPVFKHPTSKSPNILNASVNSIKPENGMLVLFPSYLEHSVNPNNSSKKRIVISFNVSLVAN